MLWFSTPSILTFPSLAGPIIWTSGSGLWYSGAGTYPPPGRPPYIHIFTYCGGDCSGLSHQLSWSLDLTLSLGGIALLGNSTTLLCCFPLFGFPQLTLPSTGYSFGQFSGIMPPPCALDNTELEVCLYRMVLLLKFLDL